MARVQVLPLPPKTVGEMTATPFVLIIDRLAPHSLPTDEKLATVLKERTGATSVWFLDFDLDVGQPLTLTPEQEATIIERLGAL